MMTSSGFDEDIQLEDLIAFYPPSFVNKIQTKISGKKEFKELASDPFERLKKARGDYFKHQKFVQRFLQHYDDLLLFHETGTGKSCAMTAAAELLKQLHSRGDTHINRAYFIVNNKQLKERIINEIVCKCTDGVYDVVRSGKDPKRETNKNLKQWYTVIERETFARELAKKSNEYIVKNYSNAIFFVDEAHNLRFEPFKGEIEEEEEDIGRKLRKDELRQFKVDSLRKLAEELELEDVPEKKADLIQFLSLVPSLTLNKIKENIASGEYELIKKTKKKVRPAFSKEDQYIQYWRLFHVAKNVKKVLATATPMVNEPDEIRDLLNLLLPAAQYPLPDFESRYINIRRLDPYLDIPSDVNILDMSDEELERKFRGKVSYVRRLDTGVDIEYMGIPISDLRNYPHREDIDYKTETKVYMERMGDFQADIYKRVSKLKDELRDKERQVSNWVYPDGSFGTGKRKGKKGKQGGAAKYLEKEGNKYIVRTTTPAGRRFKEGEDFQKQISKDINDPTGIAELGIKFANIIKLAESIKGNVFVYSNYAKASGAVPFTVCLEAQGYKMFNEPQSVFKSATPMSIPTYCKTGDSNKVITIKKEKRYAYLAHGIVGPRLDAMLEVMNSYENRHGEYIKIFITTPVGGEGISLSNVLQIHLMDSDWKHATNYQAESRAIRATSHDDLLKEGESVVVKVYNHASYTCLPATDEELCENGDSELLSVDVDLYELSEKKDREIKRMERLIKRVAVDCQLHLLRNTRRGSPKIVGKDGTAECDYAECVYKCWDPEPDYTDYSTYDVYYIDEPIEAVTRVIQEYFKDNFSVTMEKIVELIRDDAYPMLYLNIPAEMKYVQYAAEEILHLKQRFFNRYGQLSYLQKDGDVLFLTLDFPISDVEDEINMDSDVVNYTSDLIGILDVPLSEVPKPEAERQKELRVEELEGFDIYTPEFEKRFYNLEIKTLAEDLLEDALIRMEEGREDDLSVTILERLQQNLDPPDPLYPYVGMWYRIREPKNLIARIQKRLDVKSGLIRDRDGEFGKMQGRKPKTGEREPDKIIYDPSEMHNFRIYKGSKKEKIDWGGGDEDVYFHALYSLEPKKTKKFNAVPTFNNVSGTIRIYKPSESTIDDSNEIKWRDATPVEQVAYSLWVQKKLYEFKQPYEDSDAYGFYLAGKDPKFMIRTKFKEREAIKKAIKEASQKGKKVTKTGHRANRGRNCGSYKIPDLIEILQFLGLEPPDMDMEDIRDMTRDELVKEIIHLKKQVRTEDMDMENLYYILAWLRYLGPYKQKEHMCGIIAEEFSKRGLIFQTY